MTALRPRATATLVLSALIYTAAEFSNALRGGWVTRILLKLRQYLYWLEPHELPHTALLMHMMELLYACSTHANQLPGLSVGHDAMGQAMQWFCDVDKQELEITCEVEESLMY